MKDIQDYLNLDCINYCFILFEQVSKPLGDSGGQRNLACCSPWGQKELDTMSNSTTKYMTSCILAALRNVSVSKYCIFCFYIIKLLP